VAEKRNHRQINQHRPRGVVIGDPHANVTAAVNFVLPQQKRPATSHSLVDGKYMGFAPWERHCNGDIPRGSCV